MNKRAPLLLSALLLAPMAAMTAPASGGWKIIEKPGEPRVANTEEREGMRGIRCKVAPDGKISLHSN